MDKKGLLPEDFLNDLIFAAILLVVFTIVFVVRDIEGVVGVDVESIVEGVCENEANFLLLSYLRSEVSSGEYKGLSHSDLIGLASNSDDGFFRRVFTDTPREVLKTSTDLWLESISDDIYVKVSIDDLDFKVMRSLSAGTAYVIEKIGKSEAYVPVSDGGSIKVELEAEVVL